MREYRGPAVLAAIAFGIGLASAGTAQMRLPPAQPVDMFKGQPRVIAITDIGGDPDDQESFVRFLLYSNEYDIEAMIAIGGVPKPEQLRERIEAYGQVRPNLLLHAKGWPEKADLLSRVYSGQAGRNLAQTGPGKASGGSQAIVRAIERDDPRPVWITVWGGPNTLAQALIDLRAKHTPEEMERLIAKVRVYAISDQDDSGPWIRREFPKLFYIVNPSHGGGEPGSFDQYLYATWQGIGGDRFFRNGDDGADFTTVSNDWLAANIGAKGPLGKLYPRYAYIMEGDTPSFLGLIDNGLNAYRRPDWGGWGGRYNYVVTYGEQHPIWTSGGIMNFTGMNSQDEVIGADGRKHVSDQATIWRWRSQFQNDFAARMDWTIRPYKQANHNPQLVVNGDRGTGVIERTVAIGEPVVLDAAGSRDPDGDRLTYRWFHYAEAGTAGAYPAITRIEGADTPRATVTLTEPCKGTPCAAHIILAVTDQGSPNLTSYRRVILTPPAPPPAPPQPR